MNVVVKTALIAGGVALIAGIGIGSASNEAPAQEAKSVTTPGPTKTVTAPAAAPATVKVKETPTSCTNALDKADSVIVEAGESMGVIAAIFGQLAEGDLSGLETATDKLAAGNKRLVPKIEAYKAARDDCKAS